MRWRADQTRGIATSECGHYEVKHSRDANRGDFYNAWFLPANKHIAADHQKQLVVDACMAHAAKAGA